MPVDQVIDLLTRWRTSSGMRDRGRLVRETGQTLRRLTPDERRTVARSLAERGIVPALADRLDDGSGSSRDIRPNDLIRGLVTMDRAQVDDLIADLRDADTRTQLAQDAFARLTDPPPGGPPTEPDPLEPPSHAPDDVPAPPPPTGRPVADTPPPRPQSDDAAAAASPAAAKAAAGAAAAAGLAAGRGADLAQQDLPAIPDWANPPAPDAKEDDAAPADADAEDGASILDALPPLPSPATGMVSASDAPRSDAPAAATTPDFDGADDAADDLLTRVREATTANDRLGALPRKRDTADDRFAPGTVIELLHAVPDGWQRRRFAVRLTELDVIPPEAIDAALAAFGRTSDATFVAGAMVANTGVHPDLLAGLIDDRALRRLQIRAAR